jgi:hypothetical protein
MAKKARKKSATKRKKKSTPARKKRKVAVRKKPKVATRKKAARKAKPRGIIRTIVADVKAVVDTLTDAERLHRKMEPRVSSDPE